MNNKGKGNGTVVRVEKNKNFTAMSNYHLWDKRLSFKAKGLMSFMLSVSDNWKFTIRGLASMAKDGADSVASAVKELENAGYVIRSRSRNEKGQMGEVEYTIYENPGDNNSVKENAEFFMQSDFEDENPDKQTEFDVVDDNVESIIENDSENEEETSEHNESTDTLKPTDIKSDIENLISAKTFFENCSDEVSVSENEKEKYTVINPKEEKPVLINPVQENPILDNPIRGKPKRENPVQENPPQINTKLNKY